MIEIKDGKNYMTESIHSKENVRDSGIELFRIVTMIVIICSHYVHNSGLLSIVQKNPLNVNSMMWLIFGAWGKVGINSFVFITGYFMCKSKITSKKFFKFFFEVLFYKLIIYTIFVITGYIKISISGIVSAILPFTSVNNNFVGCYLIFFLLIPFLNTLLNKMNERQHVLLIILLVFIYVILASVPFFTVDFNYISLFILLYLIAAYIRFYPKQVFNKKGLWTILTIITTVLSVFSIMVCAWVGEKIGKQFIYFFVIDSNKILAIVTAFCAFNFFKNLKFKNKFINTVASTVFGVLLIHSNSATMRTWLWVDTIKVVQTINANYAFLHAVVSVLLIFTVCVIIDYLRIIFIEKPILKKFENVFDKIDDFFINGKQREKNSDKGEKE